jgi:hypothetical protein
MILLSHLTIRVSNYTASRDWYVKNVGFRVEFENIESGFGGALSVVRPVLIDFQRGQRA